MYNVAQSRLRKLEGRMQELEDAIKKQNEHVKADLEGEFNKKFERRFNELEEELENKIEQRSAVGAVQHSEQNSEVLPLFQVELNLMNRVTAVITEYRNSLSTFIGGLAFLYTTTVPCDTQGLFDKLVWTGCIGIGVFGVLGLLQLGGVWGEFKYLKGLYDLSRNRSAANNVNIRSREKDAQFYKADIENQKTGLREQTKPLLPEEDKVVAAPSRSVTSFWGHMWAPMLRIVLLATFAMMFAGFAGKYLHQKRCEKKVSLMAMFMSDS